MLSDKELGSIARMNKNTISNIFHIVSSDITSNMENFLGGYDGFIDTLESRRVIKNQFACASEEYKAGFRQGANNIYGIIGWERDREIEAVESKYIGMIDYLEKITEDLK